MIYDNLSKYYDALVKDDEATLKWVEFVILTFSKIGDDFKATDKLATSKYLTPSPFIIKAPSSAKESSVILILLGTLSENSNRICDQINEFSVKSV